MTKILKIRLEINFQKHISAILISNVVNKTDY